ncbi:capsid protein [Rheinheimera mesophila]|uniref:Capsid protein n=1 Tax=Rheinheimera mesophila TaxID=1547515 RepID=A0A3P3QR12_9GAMM|nr:GPO family capsid scaffolding protein [Rheinheimera mesophila]KKK99841.1 hypothetical protein SD53_17775 [Rheinheimera mesophila]RRJ22743.1 capsid protein [Rheinheimera mesophila]
MPKQTGWVIAATEGATVDGRIISAQWINDMAAQYSPDEYTALIWPEHFRSSWGPYEGKNWGTVDEVKAAKEGGKLRLFVKLTANDYLLEANKDGQKLFMSIEPNVDYKGTGKAYLQGIAVTDSPASTGTTRLKFSVGDTKHDYEVSQLEVLLNTDFIKDQSEPTDKNYSAKEKGLFAVLADYFKTFKTPDPATDPTEDEEMKQEQFDALMQKVGGIETKVNELETKFSKGPEGDKPKGKEGESTAENEDDKGGDKSGAGFNADQFNKLNESITGLVQKVEGLETKFAKMSAEVPGQEPDPAGAGETVQVV